MNILLTGVECNNKGAELMLCAMVEHIRSNFPGTKLVCGFGGKYEDRVGRGLYQPMSIKYQRLAKLLDRFFPGQLTNQFGIIFPRSIDLILDASGFCFGDTWAETYVARHVSHRIQYHPYGAKLILLPQAFGPFQRENIRKICKELFDKAVLIFPRDIESFDHVHELIGSKEKLYLATDFTNILQGFVPQTFEEKYRGAVGILPNEKMISKNEKPLQQAYITFLAKCIQKLAEKNIPHFLFCNQKEDIEVVNLLKARLGQLPYVLSEANPLYIKGILGTCRFLIGSRFHGLINGFSQGVPCIGTSWSHKYKALFEDYHCSEYLILDFTSFEKTNQLIDRLLNDNEYSEVRTNIQKHSLLIKQKTVNMWDIVDSFLQSVKSK